MNTGDRQLAYERGLTAEKIAANYLRQKGCEIIAERYKTKYGEIDLLAMDGEYLVAVEVKSRKTLEEALYSVTARARKRIEQSMLYYLSQNPEAADCAIRFDVITVTPPLNIQHLDNAWQPEA